MSAFSEILNSMQEKDNGRPLKELLKKLTRIAMNRTKNHFTPMGDHDMANDIVSRTLEKALEKQHQFSGDKIDAWLVDILKKTHLDIIKKGMIKERSKEERKIFKKRLADVEIELILAEDKNNIKEIEKLKEEKKELERKEKKKVKGVQRETENTPESGLQGEEITALLERDSSKCLGELSNAENDILALRQLDYDFNEISLDLGITSVNARVINLRAKEKYINCMEGRA